MVTLILSSADLVTEELESNFRWTKLCFLAYSSQSVVGTKHKKILRPHFDLFPIGVVEFGEGDYLLSDTFFKIY